MEILIRIRDLFFRVKYYFDQGNSFWPIVSFSMLAVVIAKQFGFQARWFLPLAAGVVLLVIAAVGYVMVKWGRAPQKMEEETLKRSPAWKLHEDNNRMLKQILNHLQEGK